MKKIFGRTILETLDEITDPPHTAFFVIDVQNDNASPKGFLGSKGIDISPVRQTIPHIKAVLQEARRIGLLVIFMRMTKSKDGSIEPAPRLRMLDIGVDTRAGTDYEKEGTWGNEVLDELQPRPDERQIVKYFSSGFLGTPLDSILKNRGIQCAVVAGQSTEGCVETTVRDIEQYGYYAVVLSDCVSSRRSDLHQASMLVMSARHDVISSQELLKIWRRGERPAASARA